MDYAIHIMKAINALKKMHNLCEEKNFDEAIECGLEAIAESRMATLFVRTKAGDNEPF
jgi:hypothetical protein